MNNFWKNIFRYPRFFISSFIGLILVILTPFKNLLKLKKFKILLPVIILLIGFFLFFILKEMTVSY